jgi:hypothetical protein
MVKPAGRYRPLLLLILVPDVTRVAYGRWRSEVCPSDVSVPR